MYDFIQTPTGWLVCWGMPFVEVKQENPAPAGETKPSALPASLEPLSGEKQWSST